MVCLHAAATHAFVPCGHLSCCAECSARVMEGERRRCPYCSTVASMAMRVRAI